MPIPEVMAETVRRWIHLLAMAGLALSLGACGGAGCGDTPQPKRSTPTTSGTAGKASGSGEVALGKNSQEAINAPLRRDAAPQERSSHPEAKPAAPTGADFADMNKALYESKVIKVMSGVLVVSYTPGCKGWSDMQAALKGLSEDLAGRVAVYRLDVSDPDQATVLPSGMTRLPVPGFAYYESGQALAQRQGLPFDRRLGAGGEPLEDSRQYQDRLRRWLRDAVAAKNFNLPEPKAQ